MKHRLQSRATRAVLTDDIGKRTIVWFTAKAVPHDQRQASVRIDNHPLVEVTILRSGLVHWRDRTKLEPVAAALGVPLDRLTGSLREHALKL